MSVARLKNIRIGQATTSDSTQFVQCVERLLIELGGPSPVFNKNKSITLFNNLVSNSQEFIAILAEDILGNNRNIVGLVTLSLVDALRTSGRYGIIQEAWVDQNYRSLGLGKMLIAEIDRIVDKLHLDVIEVALPNSSYKNFNKLRNFYIENGFICVGSRMRKMF